MSQYASDFSEFDKALIEKLQGLTLPDEDNIPIAVPVMYISPDGDFAPETYPVITIYRAGVYQDNTRWSNELFYDNVSFDSKGDPISMDVRSAPIPLVLFYGVRLHYQYQEDGVILNTFIHKKLHRGSYITLKGEKYDVDLTSYRNPSVTYREFGSVKLKDKREFTEQYLCKVRMELDIHDRSTVKVNTKGISPRVSYRKGRMK